MELLNPEWLFVWIAIPILAVAAVLIWRFRGRPWDAFSAERLKGKLVRTATAWPRWVSFGMLLAAAGVMVFALARPQGDTGEKVEKTKGRNVMIVLDLSRSMNVSDVNPDRLSQAKVLIYELLEKLEGDRVGLVGFAGKPLLAAPLTIDHDAVRETVEQIDGNWPTVGGSDIAAAVRMGTEVLKQTGQKTNAMILISDGEENDGDLDATVTEAERSGVVIVAVGMGTTDGGFVPNRDFKDGFMVDRSGSKVLSRLQPDVLRKLAGDTGGRYLMADGGTNIPEMVKTMVAGMDVFEMEGAKRRVVVEFYQWAILPGILFLMASVVAGTRWRALPGFGIFLVSVMMSGSVVGGQVEDARQAFLDGKYDVARDWYRGLAEKAGEEKGARYRLGEGLAAYEAEDFRGARAAFSAAMLSEESRVVGEAHEGLGNTLFQLGWMGLTGSRYPVGEAVPDMEKFDALVRDQLDRLAKAEVPESGETNEFIRIESILLNWADAVRHYRSAKVRSPSDGGAARNEEMVMTYLVRLKELLEEEKDQAEQEMMEMESQMQQGGGQGQEPQEGEGSGEEQEGEGGGEGEESGDGKNEGNDGEQGEKGDKGDDGEKGKDKKDEGDEGEGVEGEKEGDGENPNKTPEERAMDNLKENSDLERGPLGRARRDFKNPEKDW